MADLLIPYSSLNLFNDTPFSNFLGNYTFFAILREICFILALLPATGLSVCLPDIFMMIKGVKIKVNIDAQPKSRFELRLHVMH